MRKRLTTKGKVTILVSQVALIVVIGVMGIDLVFETLRDADASNWSGGQVALSIVMVVLLVGLELSLLRSFIVTMKQPTSRDV